MEIFTIHARPGTDIWRKPPSTDVFNAPSSAPFTTRTTGPLSSFFSARVSFLLPAKEQYDQGGLLLSLRPHSTPSSTSTSPPPKWIKTGVEFYNGVPKVGTVACDTWADWSLAPVQGKEDWVTFSVEASGDELGHSIWVYQVVGEEKVPIREVCWVFGNELVEWDVNVAAYAARPAKGTKEELAVQFKGFTVEWKD